MQPNIYHEEVIKNLPRILALFDRDKTSQSYGLGDRYFWAWGLIDFGNATFQGATHGMAQLWSADLWPYKTSQQKFLARIDSLFEGTNTLTRRDGSLEEAFANEGSYCVTALVAFDHLCTLTLLEGALSPIQRQRWQSIIGPLVGFLKSSDETHALISNHLATAIAALVRWYKLTGDKEALKKAAQLRDRVLANQSDEGWFKEYEGADPGYESLCLYYLADVHAQMPEWNLAEVLAKSVLFLSHFAFPDGSFGGVFSSRNTRFFCPAGCLELSKEVPEAGDLSAFMAQAISNQKVITLSAIDEPNLIPFFNAYCRSASIAKSLDLQSSRPVPACQSSPAQIYFEEAGLLIDRGVSHYTVVSTHKGGVVYHFRKGCRDQINGGRVITDPKGMLASTQAYNRGAKIEVTTKVVKVKTPFIQMPKALPSSFKFLVLRIMCLTIFKSRSLREFVKRLLVRHLITKQVTWPVDNERVVYLGEKLTIEDRAQLDGQYRLIDVSDDFISIHMASKGYWQIGDEDNV